MEPPESLGESTSNGKIPKYNHSSSSSDESSSSTTTTSRSNPSEIRRNKLLIQRNLRELSSIVNNPAVQGSNKEMSLGDAAANCDGLLENAIKYAKQLQDRVNSLKEQISGSCQDDDDCDREKPEEKVLPEIKAKTQGKDVLISIVCERKKGYLTKTISEIEKLHLNVTNTSALPFGDHFFAITVSAQMGNDLCMTAKDIKRNLGLALLEFM